MAVTGKETPLASGITAETPNNILFGAGTIHKGLKWSSGTGWNYKESLAGATKGGSKVEIKPEIKAIEVDGANVRICELDQKVGETAEMEINFAEVTDDILTAAVIGAVGESDAEGFKMIKSKPTIEKGDYWENIAFVGKTASNKPVIVILENAICTSGLPLEGKNKENSAIKVKFECCQKLDADHNTLPWKIYWPTGK